MYKSPECGEEAISNFSEFMLGPGRTICLYICILCYWK